jgi:hypothetical protein
VSPWCTTVVDNSGAAPVSPADLPRPRPRRTANPIMQEGRPLEQTGEDDVGGARTDETPMPKVDQPAHAPSPAQHTGIPLSEAALRLGIAVEAVRKRIRRGSLDAVKVDGRWHVLLPDGPDNPTPGLDTIRGSDAVQVQRATSVEEATVLEMLRWLRDLQEENRSLAGQLGFAQAQLQQAQDALRMLAPGAVGVSANSAQATDDASRQHPSPPRRWWKRWMR